MSRRSPPLFFVFIFYFSLVSLIADGPHHYHPALGSSHLSPVHALRFFLSRCKFSTLTTRQLMVGFYLLTFPRFPLRKKERKSYFGKNRTHDFRTSRCAGYLLDHSGDEGCKLYTYYINRQAGAPDKTNSSLSCFLFLFCFVSLNANGDQ